MLDREDGQAHHDIIPDHLSLATGARPSRDWRTLAPSQQTTVPDSLKKDINDSMQGGMALVFVPSSIQ